MSSTELISNSYDATARLEPRLHFLNYGYAELPAADTAPTTVDLQTVCRSL
jgi:hypothetical protein